LDIIHLLPNHVANQIAAGEVIQRPASVVKEILENSLDAGSSEIKLYIKDAGKTLIEIIDNGCGMSKNDLKMCFERHATSKIKDIEDIFKIKTMGFRGEAMASIAAISHVEVKTKLTDKELGSHLIISGSQIKEAGECATFDGTSIKIKNLFYNVPARRNFLKSDKVEMNHIIEEFTRFSLANPEIKMQLFHNTKEIFHLTKNNFRKRIINIIGDRKNKDLVPIEEETTLVKIKGFIGKPELAKRTRGEQYFFVNGRFIKDYYLNHAVNKAFKDIIADNYFASYFINITIDPQLIDINIHPTKTEVKFEDEKAIYAIMRSTIRKSLGQYNIAPSIDFANEISLDIQNVSFKKPIQEPQIKVDRSYNPFKKTIENDKKGNEINQELNLNQILLNKDFIESTQNKENIMQVLNKYILLINDHGISIINQRRAHKRVLYEDFVNNIKSNNSQKLLFPKTIKLNNLDLNVIKTIEKELIEIGFLFEEKNDNKLLFLAIPQECDVQNLQNIIEEIIEQQKNNEKIENTSKNFLAKTLSSNYAISNSKKLKKQEMIEIKDKLLKCSQPNFCPSGRKTMINLSSTDLENYF